MFDFTGLALYNSRKMLTLVTMVKFFVFQSFLTVLPTLQVSFYTTDQKSTACEKLIYLVANITFSVDHIPFFYMLLL